MQKIRIRPTKEMVNGKKSTRRMKELLLPSENIKWGRRKEFGKPLFDHKLYQKDRIRKSITRTKKYFPNGRMMERGQSRLDISENERHWYYFGEWKYYNDQGKLLYVKNYHQGKKVDSISYIK